MVLSLQILFPRIAEDPPLNASGVARIQKNELWLQVALVLWCSSLRFLPTLNHVTSAQCIETGLA